MSLDPENDLSPNEIPVDAVRPIISYQEQTGNRKLEERVAFRKTESALRNERARGRLPAWPRANQVCVSRLEVIRRRLHCPED